MIGRTWNWTMKSMLIFTVLFACGAGITLMMLTEKKKAPEGWMDLQEQAGTAMENYPLVEPVVTAPKVEERKPVVPQQPKEASSLRPENGRINVNTATAAELDKLPGIGPSKAQAIVDYREEHGAFTSLEQIDKVKGVGPKLFQNIRDRISLE
ncbi:ComEA family DNA-binding protein [Paenibacillus gansuensis]|uniref:ComEA family DNA-binding protein n=1 Tax=Paenibacillus gansuensis TaxID=306542 RepID=A0ABW5PBV4_9BACL